LPDQITADRAEIQQQALPNIALTNAWKAGGTAGLIHDDWARHVQ